jgi:hypothetical protein
MEIFARNINEAFVLGWQYMMDDSVMIRNSRNGPVREEPTVTTTLYHYPRERVLFHPLRDCNPFFHLFESIWMLAGRNDVAYLARYLPRMKEYSDDGVTLNSAYGARWKDLLPVVVSHLQKDPDSRRAYLPIFQPHDVNHTGKDMPCNTGVSFYIRNGALDMAVFNRSNDMVWGAYGANVVHFSFLQEYVATLLNVEVGQYSQVSSCFHLYTDFDITKRMLGKIDPLPFDPYETGDVRADGPMVLSHHTAEEQWQAEAAEFFKFCETNATSHIWEEPFFEVLAVPMQEAWVAYKNKKWDAAFIHAAEIQADDWRTNVIQWLKRRKEKADGNAS